MNCDGCSSVALVIDAVHNWMVDYPIFGGVIALSMFVALPLLSIFLYYRLKMNGCSDGMVEKLAGKLVELKEQRNADQ